jgi:ABC-2 type transport system permease protein
MEDKIMFKEIKFTIYSIKKNIQSSAELRTSFFMNIIGMAINNTAFIFLWVFFIKSVGIIGGWTAIDIIGLQGFIAISYGVVLSGANGLRKIPNYVATGSFDRFMLSPKNLILRIATSSFGASAIGDIVFGVICIFVYCFLIHVSLYQILIAVFLLFLASLVFLSMTILVASVSFLFTDAGSVHEGMFEIFLTPALFHGGAFQGVMRFIFTFLIPSLLIGTIPLEALKDISVTKIILMFVMSFFLFFLSIFLFKRSVRKYESSNFMTFGN